MNNDKEILEALLAGKVLISKDNDKEIQLVDGNIKLLKCPNENCIGKYQRDTSDQFISVREGYWRIKPEVIFINGIEVPAPEKVAPAYKCIYYIPNLGKEFVGICWVSDAFDLESLSKGIVHLNKDAAIAHAKALLSFTIQEKQDV